MFRANKDETIAFRKILEKIAKSHDCNFVIERFDTTKPWETI